MPVLQSWAASACLRTWQCLAANLQGDQASALEQAVVGAHTPRRSQGLLRGVECCLALHKRLMHEHEIGAKACQMQCKKTVWPGECMHGETSSEILHQVTTIV